MTVAVLHNNSAEGRGALAAAVQEATALSTDIVVLHALSGSQEPSAAASETAAVEASVRESMIDTDGISWRVVTSAPDPDATTTLLQLIEESKAERVVIGSRHRSAVGKFLMGQTIQRLLLEIRVPVLLVKPGA